MAEIKEIVKAIDRKYGAGASAGGDITPSMRTPVLVPSQSGIVPELFTWGFQGPGGLVINARAETVPERPMFRTSFLARRCIIPASGFYECSASKRKYFFTRPDGHPTYMAGLYDVQKGLPRYAIITTESNASMKDIHHRMPVILESKALRPWLFDGSAAKEILKMGPPALVREDASPQLSLW